MKLEDPGFFEGEVTAELQDNVYVVDKVAEKVSFNDNLMQVRIFSPARDYAVGEVLTFLDYDGQRVAVKTLEIVGQWGEVIQFQCEPATLMDLFVGDGIAYTYTPDFSQASAGAKIGRSGEKGFGLTIEDDNTIVLDDLPLFEINVGPEGVIEPESSSLMGIGLLGNMGAISSSDTTDCANGYLRARIISGSLRIVPTNYIDLDFFFPNDYALHGRLDAHVEYSMEIELTASGHVALEFEMPLFPPLHMLFVTGTGLEFVVTLEVPAGFKFNSSLSGQAQMSYSNEYAYSFRIDYDTRTDAFPSFSAEKDSLDGEDIGKDVVYEMEGSMMGELYLEPKAKVKLWGLVGPFVWLKPYVRAELVNPWLIDEDELFVGIEGGLGFEVGNLSRRSNDLLGITPLSWDLIGPTTGGGLNNTPPLCSDLWLTVPRGASQVRVAARDADLDPPFFSLESQPSQGTLGVLNSGTGTVTYTPTWGYLGPDSFEYTANDGIDEGNVATVHLDVVEGSLPVAAFTTSIPSPLELLVDASSSHDNEDAPEFLQYRWDFQNDGAWETPWSSSITAVHEYLYPGTYVVRLEVKDQDGMIGTRTRVVGISSESGGTFQWSFTDEGFIDGGQGGAHRDYDDPLEVAACPWSMFNDGLSVRLDWEDDGNCQNHNPHTQNATAIREFSLLEEMALTLSWSGVGETQDPSFEKMSLYIDGNLIGSAHAPGGGLGCGGGMGPVVSDPQSPQVITLQPGDHTLFIDATTNDELYHFGAWYQFHLKFADQAKVRW